MSGFTVLAVVVVIAAIMGFAFQKNGELSGLGRASGFSALRAPHGRLMRTKRLDTFEDMSFLAKFSRVLLITFAITLVLVALCAFGVLDGAGLLATSLDIVLVIGVAAALVQADVGMWRSLGYSMVGYFAGGALSVVLAALLQQVMPLDAYGINVLTMLLGTFGTSVALAAMPLMRTYAREFEDGHVDTIQVSARSVAARAFDSLVDDAWKPPTDRMQASRDAQDVRAVMKRRDK